MSGIRDLIDPAGPRYGGSSGSSPLPPRGQSSLVLSTTPASGSSSVPMDVDDTPVSQGHHRDRKEPRSLSRASSWHSDETSSQYVVQRPNSVSGHSQADNTTTSQSDAPIGSSNAEDPLFHAAYRLFKSSMKAASEKYGPYLPPDDGSPFLAHRLTRMWNDLSPEQRAGWYARAAGESSSEPLIEGRSPQSTPSGSYHFTPPSTAVSVTRTSLSGSESLMRSSSRADSLDHRSPGSYTEDELMGGTSALQRRSESPLPGDEAGGSQSHVPRPPNAWILFRSTMSKTRKPDGSVYAPPEISVMWKELSKEDRDLWYERAKEAKQQHEAANPGYKYQPNRKKPYGVRKLTESNLSSSSARSPARASHPGPYSPPWHANF